MTTPYDNIGETEELLIKKLSKIVTIDGKKLTLFDHVFNEFKKVLSREDVAIIFAMSKRCYALYLLFEPIISKHCGDDFIKVKKVVSGLAAYSVNCPKFIIDPQHKALVFDESLFTGNHLLKMKQKLTSDLNVDPNLIEYHVLFRSRTCEIDLSINGSIVDGDLVREYTVLFWQAIILVGGIYAGYSPIIYLDWDLLNKETEKIPLINLFNDNFIDDNVASESIVSEKEIFKFSAIYKDINGSLLGFSDSFRKNGFFRIDELVYDNIFSKVKDEANIRFFNFVRIFDNNIHANIRLYMNLDRHIIYLSPFVSERFDEEKNIVEFYNKYFGKEFPLSTCFNINCIDVLQKRQARLRLCMFVNLYTSKIFIDSLKKTKTSSEEFVNLIVNKKIEICTLDVLSDEPCDVINKKLLKVFENLDKAENFSTLDSTTLTSPDTFFTSLERTQLQKYQNIGARNADNSLKYLSELGVKLRECNNNLINNGISTFNIVESLKHLFGNPEKEISASISSAITFADQTSVVSCSSISHYQKNVFENLLTSAEHSCLEVLYTYPWLWNVIKSCSNKLKEKFHSKTQLLSDIINNFISYGHFFTYTEPYYIKCIVESADLESKNYYKFAMQSDEAFPSPCGVVIMNYLPEMFDNYIKIEGNNADDFLKRVVREKDINIVPNKSDLLNSLIEYGRIIDKYKV